MVLIWLLHTRDTLNDAAIAWQSLCNDDGPGTTAAQRLSIAQVMRAHSLTRKIRRQRNACSLRCCCHLCRS